LSKLKTLDGKGLYWEVLDQGHGSYPVRSRTGKPLKIPVNASVLSGYKTGAKGQAYITKFRKYWNSSSGAWAKGINEPRWKGREGYGLFNHAVVKPKRHILFIEKTAKYMKSEVDKNLNMIVERDFKLRGLKMDRRMLVEMRY